MTQSTEVILMEVFRRALSLDEDIASERIRRDDLAAWDSVGHMELVSEIESVFGLELDFDDILALDSFDQALRIVSRRHG